MKPEIFKGIANCVNNFDGNYSDCFDNLCKLYPDILPETLKSIMNKCSCQNNKKNLWKCQKNSTMLYSQFLEATSTNFPVGFVAKLAKKYGVEPLAVANVLLQEENKCNGGSTKMWHLIKDTSLINNQYLAHETFLCTLLDFSYSPIGNVIKKRTGYEYEVKIHTELKKHGLSFRTEYDLRKQLYMKTPDILLDVPIAVNNSIVRWIESKALFADEPTHKQYCQEQYFTYFDSFGPGLVIYWFGFLDGIVQPGENRYIVHDKFPDNFLKLEI
ncbi:uncharacterized protein C15orf41 homolog [Cimex lectularius]|uniref:CDAN1-interacting nuclease 1 n=1 Tax=Cimex lectularius TaxID=79782 RepID=A0A8I6RCH1_CIMLE|nr:uncharacterized protein C15orf41 homolog [Cimex lectularius]